MNKLQSAIKSYHEFTNAMHDAMPEIAAKMSNPLELLTLLKMGDLAALLHDGLHVLEHSLTGEFTPHDPVADDRATLERTFQAGGG